MTRATVIGAGVVGLCVATELVANGFDVTVYDPGHRPGPHACSWWAGGMLAPYCEGETAEEPVVRLGKEAADWWQAQGVPITRNGTLVVTLQRDRKELDRFARRTESHVALDANTLATFEPSLEGRFDRGLMFPEEAHVDPRAALNHLRDRLEVDGVRFVAEQGRSDGLTFDCRGLAARDALQDLRGVKGEMVVLRSHDIQLSRPIRLLHPRYPLYVVPRPGGIFMLGATQLESCDKTRTVRSTLELLSAAYAMHPAFGEAELLEIGVDARPAFPDNLPRVRKRGQTIYVNGLFRHGFLLSPAAARMAVKATMGATDLEFMDENHS
ncbi:MAG: FAD-dependent oxidoreductase [Pseudomonadota bacterium]|nr:FAD-dependent oxidoreductase [Pseudomonadota bacterium]MEE3069489.1 FAD-dependent oxidoreductase [Pseudomonadota bacterium]